MFALESMINYCMQNFKKLMAFIVLIVIGTSINAQPNTSVDLDKDKPKQYENRRLNSEKTDEKKFTLTRRITQNTYTHFNYYFNAYNKLQEIVAKAKSSYKDDYTKLLSFYNYNLETTSQDKAELDSVIYKCTAGILLHDLRNAWIDNLYMVLGRAYMLRKNFDSAAGCFQYINYTYAPKDDGYDVPLGSNNSNTNGVFTIATKEKRNLWKQITSRPPSRNESFIWQARNYLEQDLLGEAAGLLSILRNDPFFPKRLQTDLHEMVAYMFYKQQVYDSAAWHLQKSLDNAEDKFEKSRWEYLCGQLYQLAKKDSSAIKLYERSISHTIDPLMEVYARLNIVALASGTKKNALQENLDELLKLAKREKYVDYRDIIYYAAALLELKRDNYNAAQNNLLKSVKYNVDNPQQKAASFILLGDLNYNRKEYIQAYNFYDSVQLASAKTIPTDDSARVVFRKPPLKTISTNIQTIIFEDSVQRIAAMPEPERTIFIKKILKKLRKEQGLKGGGDEEGSYNTAAVSTKDANLFGDTKGEWYFLNDNLRVKGFNEFKSKWGKRPNVDNWRRQGAIDKIGASRNIRNNVSTTDVDDTGGIKPIGVKDDKEDEQNADLSFEGLMSKLPLTKERVETSNNKIINALYSNGETFQNKLEDYPSAIEAYDELLRRFGMFKKKEETLFNLYYCCMKAGLQAKADSAKNALNTTFGDGDFANKLRAGNNNDSKKKDEAVTKKYEDIYRLFLEGKFEEAKKEKAKADVQYSNNYWTPQLLYIESIYYIKQKADDTAINKLQSLVTLFPKSNLVNKATIMIDVLRRRAEIETYLTNLKVERNEDEAVKGVDLVTPTTAGKNVETKTTDVVKQPVKELKPIDKAIDTKPAVVVKDKFSFIAADSQYVMVVLDKVDRVFIGEAKSAFAQFNRQRYYNQVINISTVPLNEQYTTLLLGPFADAGKAMEYVDRVRPITPTQILNWLSADKYSYSIISSSNFTVLQTNKEVSTYQQLLKQALPGKF